MDESCSPPLPSNDYGNTNGRIPTSTVSIHLQGPSFFRLPQHYSALPPVRTFPRTCAPMSTGAGTSTIALLFLRNSSGYQDWYLGGSLNEMSSFFSNDLLPPINSVMIMLQFARLKTVTLSDALGAELCLASRTRLG